MKNKKNERSGSETLKEEKNKIELRPNVGEAEEARPDVALRAPAAAEGDEGEAAEKPNVRFTGRDNSTPFSGKVSIGIERPVKLPDDETQRTGFHLPPAEAARLVRTYPEHYKLITDKS